MFFVQRAKTFFQQKMQHHAHTRQRRLEFVTDGGDEVCLGVVEQSEARDVVQHHGHANGSRVGVAHEMDEREKGFFSATRSESDNLVEVVREKILVRLDGGGGGGGESRRECAVERQLRAEFLRGAIFQFDVSFVVQDEHWISERGERGFHRAMQPDDLVGGALAVSVQLRRHLVERGGEFTKFVVGKHGHGEFQFALAYFARGASKRLDGIQNSFAELEAGVCRDQQRHHESEDQEARDGLIDALNGLADGENIFTGLVAPFSEQQINAEFLLHDLVVVKRALFSAKRLRREHVIGDGAERVVVGLQLKQHLRVRSHGGVRELRLQALLEESCVGVEHEARRFFVTGARALQCRVHPRQSEDHSLRCGVCVVISRDGFAHGAGEARKEE